MTKPDASEHRALSLTGVILVGGRGTRLQSPKPLAMVGNKLILARIADALRPVCDELVAVARADQDDPTPDTAIALRMHVVPDAEPEAGPLAGVYAGLKAAVTDLCFVTAGDHPFLSRELVTAMAQAARQYAVVPSIGDRLQPLHAVYPTMSWRSAFASALARGERSVSAVVEAALASGVPPVRVWDQQRLEAYDPGLMSLIDVDTPAELARARSMADWRTNARPGLRPPGGL